MRLVGVGVKSIDCLKIIKSNSDNEIIGQYFAA
jgi:hypothetical protein